MSESINKNIAGIQLALFELIWPAFDWIEAVFIRTETGLCSVYLQLNRTPTQVEEDDCRRTLAEILEIASGGLAIRLQVTQGRQPAASNAYREVMSAEIFKRIAKDVAPWRLDAGR